MKLVRKQDLHVLYQVCVFLADRENKMTALASDWLRHFQLLLWNRLTEFNETWQVASSQHPLLSLCFSRRSGKQNGRLGLWLAETFSTSPLKPLSGIQRNLTGSKICTSSTKFVFLGRSEKQNGRPCLWLTETFSTSPLKTLNGIQRNLTGSKICTSSTKLVFFGPIGKTKLPPLPLIGWDIFNFSSEKAEQNSKKLDRKQDLNVLYLVCVFQTDRKNKIAALASDWLRHFRLLLWNRWTEFNENWQEAKSPGPLPSLYFSGRPEKQNGRPCLWLAETFSTSYLKPLNGIQRNLTGSKTLTFLPSLCFSGRPEKQNAALASDWPRHFRPFLWNRWPEFNETWQEARSARPLPSLCFLGRSEKQNAALASDWLRNFRLLLWNRWTEFNETWQEARSTRPLPRLCFLGRSEKQNAALASDWLRHFRLLLWNRLTEFNETWQEARSARPLPSLCFSRRSKKQDCRPGLWLVETFSTSPLKPLNGIQGKLSGSKISTSST